MHWELTRTREILEQRLANINYELYQLRLFEEQKYGKFNENGILNINQLMDSMKIPVTMQNDFSKIFYKKSIIVDITNDYWNIYNSLRQFENINICAFETNEIRFLLFKKQKLPNFTIIPFYTNANIEKKENLYQRDYNILTNKECLDKDYNIRLKYFQDFFKEKLILSNYEYKMLRLQIDQEGVYILNEIINEEITYNFRLLFALHLKIIIRRFILVFMKKY